MGRFELSLGPVIAGRVNWDYALQSSNLIPVYKSRASEIAQLTTRLKYLVRQCSRYKSTERSRRTIRGSIHALIEINIALVIAL